MDESKMIIETCELPLLNVCVFQLRLKPNMKETHLNLGLSEKTWDMIYKAE